MTEEISFEKIVLAGLKTVESPLKEHNIQVHIQPDMPTVNVDYPSSLKTLGSGASKVDDSSSLKSPGRTQSIYYHIHRIR